jgi:uncharacterized membrane protein YebE (DUF533 family)
LLRDNRFEEIQHGLQQIDSGIAGSALVSGLAGGVAGGALTSVLMSNEGRKFATTTATVGGLEFVGGIA